MVDEGSGAGVIDPLRNATSCGAGYLGSADDGTWRSMLEPRAHGFGMIVWTMHKACAQCGDYVNQWLLPALCSWVSITDPETGKADATTVDLFGSVMAFYPNSGDWKTSFTIDVPYGPMIGITKLFIPEKYECIHASETLPHNLELADDYGDCMEDEGHHLEAGQILGLVPVMHVIPVSTEFFSAWLIRLSKAWSQYSDVFESYGWCSCMADMVTEDPECMVDQLEKEYGTALWNNEDLRVQMYNAEANCSCAFHGFTQHFWEMVNQTPDFVDEVNDDLFEASWAYALDRYFTGWRWLEQHTPQARWQVNERTQWLTSFSSRFSPYWGPSGLLEYLKQHGLEQYAA